MPSLLVGEMPILAQLGAVEGDVLEYLELHGPTSLYRLIQAHDWPASLGMMAVGALIRQGLVRGSEQQLECTYQDDRGGRFD